MTNTDIKINRFGNAFILKPANQRAADWFKKAYGRNTGITSDMYTIGSHLKDIARANLTYSYNF
jgi:virulence-associated protein VagC